MDIERVRPVSVRAMERIAGRPDGGGLSFGAGSGGRPVSNAPAAGSDHDADGSAAEPGEFDYEVDAFHGYARRVLLPDSRSRRSRCTV
ncbi:MAG: hypothetical protein ACLT1A_00220 [Dysosmobacter sp.]